MACLADQREVASCRKGPGVGGAAGKAPPGVRGNTDTVLWSEDGAAHSSVHNSGQSNSQCHSLPGLQRQSRFQCGEIQLNSWRRVALCRGKLYIQGLDRETAAVGDGDAEECLLTGVKREWRGQNFYSVPTLQLTGDGYL